MTFLLKPWFMKTIKGIITAALAYVTGPKILPILTNLGITIDPLQAQAGAFALYVSLGNWLKHQAWVPKEIKPVL